MSKLPPLLWVMIFSQEGRSVYRPSVSVSGRVRVPRSLPELCLLAGICRCPADIVFAVFSLFISGVGWSGATPVCKGMSWRRRFVQSEPYEDSLKFYKAPLG
jgi:hypothetical protein